MQDDQVADAFVPDGRFVLEGSGGGPLAGTRFAAKDNFDVAGRVTGAGNPDWARTHAPAERTASAIERLLEQGATLVGKTQMDELAYGSVGNNEHYGMPLNPACPDRIPGGSSSGSASAVAAGDVDFALGSDTACSVRLPAALCGTFGFRPTHGRVDVAGLVPLSPSLDTVGWFARDAALLAKLGAALLAKAAPTPPFSKLLLAVDALGMATEEIRTRVVAAAERFAARIGRSEKIRFAAASEELTMYWFRAWSVQVREVWAEHGAWIMAEVPNSRVLSRANLAEGANSPPHLTSEARAGWNRLQAFIRSRIRPGTLLCLPTVTDVAPLRVTKREELRPFLQASLCLLSIATIGGCPQLQIPLPRTPGTPPIGLSLIGAPGSDEALLALASAP